MLEALARTGRKAVEPELLPPEIAEDLRTLLGRPVEDPGLVFVELMFASLEADPDNRDGYLFLLDLLRGRSGGKPRLQRVLRDMADRFPDDSTPWLELATSTIRGTRIARPRARWRRPAGAHPTTTGSWICRLFWLRSRNSSRPRAPRANRPCCCGRSRRTPAIPRWSNGSGGR